MRYTILILVALMALLPAVMANEAHSLNSFEEEPSQAIIVPEKDVVRFDLVDGRHQLYLKEIGRNGYIKVMVFPYLDLNEGSESWFAPLKVGKLLKADLDQDDTSDLYIKVIETDEEARTATLMFISVEHQFGKKEGFDETTIETKPDETDKGFNWDKVKPYMVIGALVVAIVAVILGRKVKKPSKKKKKRK